MIFGASGSLMHSAPVGKAARTCGALIFFCIKALLVLFVILLVIFSMKEFYASVFNPRDSFTAVDAAKAKAEDDAVVVLYWQEATPRFLMGGGWDPPGVPGDGTGYHPRCPIACVWTTDKAALNFSDVIFFHKPHMVAQTFFISRDPETGLPNTNDLIHYPQYPQHKRPGQIWAISSMEPQWTQTNWLQPEFMNQFDLEMSYRLNTGIPLPYFVGYMPFFEPPALKTAHALAVFVASRCSTLNSRDKYVAELMKHMRVDSYGSCLHNTDWPWYKRFKYSSKHDIISTYKFYLAFENSEEDYYVTEKFFGALIAGTVPVYMGWKDIDKISPHPDAVIKVSDFASAKDLAAYLVELFWYTEKYAKHLKWKTDGGTDKFKALLREHAVDGRCKLCYAVRKMSYPSDITRYSWPTLEFAGAQERFFKGIVLGVILITFAIIASILMKYRHNIVQMLMNWRIISSDKRSTD